MRWTALVPIKAAPARKSRLATHLSAADRTELSEAMLAQVVGRLHDCPEVGRVIVLSPLPVGDDWVRDGGRGLNEELAQACSARVSGPLMVIHADLPLLTVADVDTLLTAAVASGRAIAPDRHLAGTNAVAVADGSALAWCFGAASFARHRRALASGHAVVERTGLMLDCDTYDDLLLAEAGGFVWRDPAAVQSRSLQGETA